MQRHLVLQLARFGDLLQTKRLLTSLGGGADDEVHLLVDTSLVELARLIYPALHIHGIRAHATQAAASGTILLENRDTLFELQHLTFDSIYNINFSGMNFALASLFDPQKVVGYRWESGQPVRNQWASLAFRWTSSRRRAGINLMDFWGGYAPGPVAPDAVNPPAKPGGRGLGIVLAGRDVRRSLPPAQLAAMIPLLCNRLDTVRIVLLGSNAEKSAARECLRHLPAKYAELVQNLVGRTRLTDMPDILSGMDMVLTPDTGTMHLAAHLGVPVEALFLSSAWCFETGPYGRGHRIYQASRDCAPCVESMPCPIDRACLAPFADKSFYRYVSGRTGKGVAPGIAVYETGFDRLGVVCHAVAGEDPSHQMRQCFRQALVRYQFGEALVGLEANGCDIFQERDWILEQPRMDVE